MKALRSVLLVVSIPFREAKTLSPLLKNVIDTVRNLGPAFEGIIHWNIPLCTLEAATGTGAGKAAAQKNLNLLTSRLNDGDSVLPMGYSGIPHQRLSAAEAAEELLLSRESVFFKEPLPGPYGEPGAKTAFARTGSRMLLMPPVSFLHRTELIDRLSEEPHCAFALMTESETRRIGTCVVISGTEKKVLPSLTLNGSGQINLRKVMRGTGPESPLVLRLVIRSKSDCGMLERLLGDIAVLSKRRYLRTGRFDEPGLSGTEGSPTGSSLAEKDRRLTLPNAPVPSSILRAPAPSERAGIIEAGKMRAKPGYTAGDIRRLLSVSAGERGDRGFSTGWERGKYHGEEKTVIASMQGSVSLHEHGYSCRFTGGRLAGTSIGTGMFADIQTAAPWISRDGHEYPFKIENAYSFESGNTYGLKTSFEFSEEFTLSRECSRWIMSL